MKWKRYLIVGIILVILIVGIIFLIKFVSATSNYSVYNFNATYQGKNMFAYQCKDGGSYTAVPGTNYPPTCASGYSTITTNAGLGSIDSSYASTTDGYDYLAYQMFVGNLSGINNISNINVTWVGHASDANYHLLFYAWNYTSTAWVNLGEYSTFPPTSDVTVYYNLTNYVGSSSKNITFLVWYQSVYNGGLYTDFVQLNISSTVASANSCTYSGSGNWNILFSDYCNITSPVDVGGNGITITGAGTFTTTANITGWKTLNLSGTGANSYNAYCLNGGCFR